MFHIKRLIQIVSISFLTLAFVNCTNSRSVDTGGGSETVATITISKQKITGIISGGDTDLEKVIVKLFDTLFIPENIFFNQIGYGDTVMCDKSGHFEIAAPISGRYNIIVDNQIGQQLLLSKVPVVDLTFTIVDTLRNSGSITGNIKANTSNLTIGEKTFFSLLGTDFTTVQLASEQFEFKDIPHGKYDIFHIEKMELQDKNDTLTVKDINKKLSQTIEVESGSTSTVEIDREK